MDTNIEPNVQETAEEKKRTISIYLDISERSLLNLLSLDPLALDPDRVASVQNTTCESLSRAFSAIFGRCANRKLDISFDIVNGDGRERFFGVRVFPSIAGLEQICRAMIVNNAKIDELHSIWNKIDSWHIEMDYALFDRSQIMMAPVEIIALIMQAWSNTFREFTPLDRFSEACKEWFYVKPLSNKPNPDPFDDGLHTLSLEKREKIKLMHLLFTVPLWKSCKFPDILKENPSKSVEVYVGSIFISEVLLEDIIGRYKDAYVPTVGKLVRHFGSTFDGGEEFTINSVGSYVRWALQNAVDSNRRYHQMKDDLLRQSQLTSGQYAAALVIKLLNDFGVGLRENYTGAILESAQFEEVINERYDLDNYTALQVNPKVPLETAFEALLSRKSHKTVEPLLPSDYDIDSIGIEVDRIQNHHDRVYVLDLIYHKVEEIEAVLLYWDQPPHSNTSRANRIKAKAKQQMKILNEYRTAVMRKRNFNTDYKVFVKVPAGYEG